MPAVARLACVLALATLPVGCGRNVALLDEISGTEVGAMAEHELEAENPRIVPGTLSCPDLRFRVGSSVRCLRTATLSNGRVVKVRGTVRVTSLASGGRLHVTMDDDAAEFGVSGDQVAGQLRARSRQLFHRTPGSIACPYLRGEVGARVICRVQVGGASRLVDAVVTAVEAASYDVRYRFEPHRAAS